VIPRTTRAESPATIRFVFGRSLKRYLEKRDEELREEARKRDAEGRARWAQLEELRAKSDARAEETREFNREILLRNEKVYTSLIAQVEENTEQIRANTRAVLSVLDRFNGSSA
jgi:hypothetical protein